MINIDEYEFHKTAKGFWRNAAGDEYEERQKSVPAAGYDGNEKYFNGRHFCVACGIEHAACCGQCKFYRPISPTVEQIQTCASE